jgi:peptidoglycan-associated lipoprotein
MKRIILFCMAATIILLYGCAEKPVHVPLAQRVPVTTPGDDQKSAVTDSQKGKEGVISEEELLRQEQERKRRAAEEEAAKARFSDVYFEFDSYVIRSEDIPILKEAAAWLIRNEAVKLTIEGHCDERGTTDYNLALGQKRAEAARDYLAKLGVSDTRMRVVSYGKEAPMDTGHTEASWAKNRRAHFIFQ